MLALAAFAGAMLIHVRCRTLDLAKECDDVIMPLTDFFDPHWLVDPR